jgi:hypothetical protein
MIYRGIKAKRSDKASAIFLYAGEYTKALCLQHVPEQQLRYYRHCFNIPFKFTVKG